MDKKNKKNGVTTASTEDKDRKRPVDSPASKPKPVNIAISNPITNGDKATKARAVNSAGVGGDKDARRSSSNDEKAHDEPANKTSKIGPQKKRRKVTHGTALHFPIYPTMYAHEQKHEEAVVSSYLWARPVRDNPFSLATCT